MSIGARVKEARLAAKLTQKALASRVGMTQGALSALETGDSQSTTLIASMAAALSVNALWLETGKGPMRRDEGEVATEPPAVPVDSNVEDAPAIMRKPQLIPVVGRVQAGDDGLLHIDDFSGEHPEGYLLWYATCPEAYALRIRGESMSPRYLPGEFAGVDPCSDVLPSDEVIVFLKDGRRMIKRFLWDRDGQACYESVNKNYPNIIFDCDEIEKMHRVAGHIDRSAFRPNI